MKNEKWRKKMEVTYFYNYGTMNQVEPGATQINHYYGSGKAEKEEVDLSRLQECAESKYK